MKALVTGGGGFLGRYIVEQLLARGDAVTVFARGDYPELAASGATLVRGDIQDWPAVDQACKGMDTVFHVAARAGVWGPWESFYGVNVIGTGNIIAACRQNSVRKLIYTSSPSVVFDNTSHKGVNEDYPYPQTYESFYPETKARGEQLVIAANGVDGLITVSLRPHLIWGPRDTHLLPGVLAAAKSGTLPQVGDGTNKVDLTYVEDAALAHLLAADALEPGSPVAGSCYFISQGEPVVVWPWIKSLLQELNLPGVRMTLPLPVARAIGAALEASYTLFGLKGEPRLTRFLASELAQSHYYDISRAQKDFGYVPQFTMEAALDKTLAYLKAT
ncbi:MAG: NAD-dependent epimerase/dehydratase family protein [Anaerolineae bacterium]|nr:NAD-dependent epimerase/dehydratase family protein [Anaerolineae bacterium]